MISEQDFEQRVAEAAATAPSETAGLFGPGSMTWHVNRESALFLGAGRALLLQLAHPWVAAAISEHSTAVADPMRRFHGTFSNVFAMVFGSTAQALDAARRLHRRHSAVIGTIPVDAGPYAAGSAYLANDVEALRWVHATLVESALAAYGLVLPPLSSEERERYWREARQLAALFGIPDSSLPSDWAAFANYVVDTVESTRLEVTPEARRIAHALLGARVGGMKVPRWYTALTAQLLPNDISAGFGLAYSEADQRSAERVVERLARLYGRLPARVRFVGPYHEAVERLAGRDRPSALTRASNRLWIGRESIG